MTINFIFSLAHGPHQPCPNCGSGEDIIPWGNGWMCRDCGYEWAISHSEH